ncbi:MAG: hypothetical protein AAB857_03765 [Patescibacteria group bacterium]
MNTHLKIYLLVLILVALAIAGFFWWQGRQSAETPSGLGSELYPETGNPADNLPAVNPLENKPAVNPLSESNPFTDIKTNPFR